MCLTQSHQRHVNGDVATIIYDVYFGDSPAYTDLDRVITRVDGVWVVTEGLLRLPASARTPCN